MPRRRRELPSTAISIADAAHAAVLETLRRRDAKAAIKLMDEHLIHVEHDLAKLLTVGSQVDLEDALSLPRLRLRTKAAA
jgi:DNA-binding GntR family transcriptional regulator